jgi:hypothetical protein
MSAQAAAPVEPSQSHEAPATATGNRRYKRFADLQSTQLINAELVDLCSAEVGVGASAKRSYSAYCGRPGGGNWRRNGRGQGRPPLAFPVTLLRLRSAGHDGVPGAAIATADCDCVGPACEAFPLGQA